MNTLLGRKKNVYLDKINESLVSFFRLIEKFNQTLNELNQVSTEATVHINEIERIIGDNDNDNDDNDNQDEDAEQQLTSYYARESMAAEKLCELNENLNVLTRQIRQSW